jgi:hypothetical protein
LFSQNWKNHVVFSSQVLMLKPHLTSKSRKAPKFPQGFTSCLIEWHRNRIKIYDTRRDNPVDKIWCNFDTCVLDLEQAQRIWPKKFTYQSICISNAYIYNLQEVSNNAFCSHKIEKTMCFSVIFRFWASFQVKTTLNLKITQSA